MKKEGVAWFLLGGGGGGGGGGGAVFHFLAAMQALLTCACRVRDLNPLVICVSY
jgi:hypothetical protein